MTTQMLRHLCEDREARYSRTFFLLSPFLPSFVSFFLSLIIELSFFITSIPASLAVTLFNTFKGCPITLLHKLSSPSLFLKMLEINVTFLEE